MKLHVQNIVREEIEDRKLIRLEDFQEYMNTFYVTKDHMSHQIDTLLHNLERKHDKDAVDAENNLIEDIQKEVKLQMEKQLQVINSVIGIEYRNLSDFEAYINESVGRALEVYDADKTERVDYALESSGGSVVSTRCSESTCTAKTLSILGIPILRTCSDPRVVLQPSIHPGECWAFSGSRGYLVIRLSHVIFVTGITIEHIPKTIAAFGSIDSAPNEFSLWGLNNIEEDHPLLLGRFNYDQNGKSLQYFETKKYDTSYQYVELTVESNHGNIDYTCIYRIRIHGIPAPYQKENKLVNV